MRLFHETTLSTYTNFPSSRHDNHKREKLTWIPIFVKIIHIRFLVHNRMETLVRVVRLQCFRRKIFRRFFNVVRAHRRWYNLAVEHAIEQRSKNQTLWFTWNKKKKRKKRFRYRGDCKVRYLHIFARGQRLRTEKWSGFDKQRMVGCQLLNHNFLTILRWNKRKSRRIQ